MTGPDPASPSSWENRATFGLSTATIITTVIALLFIFVPDCIARSQPVVFTPIERLTEIKVAVRGAVANPGVYTLQEGDRVEDAIRAAGGILPNADPRSFNPAARIRDEVEILVAQADETPRPPTPIPSATSNPRAPAKVNLNTATAAQLVALPGIADLTARRIIDSRQQAGPFQRIEELRERGIMNDQNYDRVKDLVTAP